MVFPSGPGPASCTGYPEPECEHELFAVQRVAGAGRAAGTGPRCAPQPPDATPPRAGRDGSAGAPLAPEATPLRAGRGGHAGSGSAPTIPKVPQQQPGRGGGDTGPAGAFVRLADVDLRLHEGTLRAGKAILDPDDRFLTPAFVKGLREGTHTDPFFGPIFQGATASPGQAVDSHGRAVQRAKEDRRGRADVPRGGIFIIRCGLLYREGQGRAARLCIPEGGGLRTQVMRDLHWSK